jgi:hypothetical protein
MQADHNRGSRAVLIGVSEYDHAEFTPIRSARNSLAAMEALLLDPALCGWSRDQLTVISNPRSASDLGIELTELAKNTTGVFLLYYVGHGKITDRADLCLTVSSTHPAHPQISGLRWDTVRHAFLNSGAQVRVAILDCCFAGRAIEALAGDGDHTLADLADIRGSYILTAARSNDTAHVPPPAEQEHACTSFTGEFRDLVRAGIAGKPDWLTFSDIYPELRTRLRARGLPAPERRGTDTADLYRFAANAATRRTTSSVGASQHESSVVDPARHSRELARTVQLTVELQEAVDNVQANLARARAVGETDRVLDLEKELAGRLALLAQAHKSLRAFDG